MESVVKEASIRVEKVSKAAKELIAYICYTFLDNTCHFDGSGDDNPLFSLLSLPHQIELVSEMMVNLLCDSLPPPQSTNLNKVILFAIFDLFKTQIIFEADTEGDMSLVGEEKCHEEICEEKEGEDEEFSKALKNITLENVNNAMRSFRMNIPTKGKVIGSADRNIFSEKTLERGSKKGLRQNFEDFKIITNSSSPIFVEERIKRQETILKDIREGDYGVIRFSETNTCYCFMYRKLCIEYVQSVGPLKDIMKFHPSFFHCYDIDLWKQVINSAMYYFFLDLSKRNGDPGWTKDYEFHHKFFAWSIFQGTEKQKRLRVSYLSVNAQEHSERFERSWSLSRTFKYLHVLTHLSSGTIAFYHAAPFTWRNNNNKYLQEKLKGFEEMGGKGTNKEEEEGARKWAIANLKFHLYVHDYDSYNEKYRAILKAMDEVYPDGEKITYFPEVGDICSWSDFDSIEKLKESRRWKMSLFLCFQKCEFCKSEEKRKLRFKRCGRCRVLRYCSKGCQVKDWKRHKKSCKQFDEMYKEEVLRRKMSEK